MLHEFHDMHSELFITSEHGMQSLHDQSPRENFRSRVGDPHGSSSNFREQDPKQEQAPGISRAAAGRSPHTSSYANPDGDVHLLASQVGRVEHCLEVLLNSYVAHTDSCFFLLSFLVQAGASAGNGKIDDYGGPQPMAAYEFEQAAYDAYQNFHLESEGRLGGGESRPIAGSPQQTQQAPNAQHFIPQVRNITRAVFSVL